MDEALNKEQLEAAGFLEVCNHCGSAYIIELTEKIVMCGKCGAEGYTKYIKEEDYGKD